MASPPVVLITGANRGIGFFIAQLLSQSKHSYSILIGARSLARSEEAVATLSKTKSNPKTTIGPLIIDISSSDSINGAVESVSKSHGRLDVLINNAAIGSTVNFENATSKRGDWLRVFDTNVFGTIEATYALLPLLQKSTDAKIIMVSSSVGSIGMTEAAPKHPLSRSASPYKASKAALNMAMVEMVKTLEGIRLWGVDPGLCATDFMGDYSRDNGRDPKEGADIARQCIEGEIDDCVGKVVWQQNGTGVRPW